MKRTALRLAVAGTIVAASQILLAPGASAHPFGMCHVAGQSGVVVYFPPGQAANSHERLMQRGIHPNDYAASQADAQDFQATGNRKCAESRVNPTG